jgi:hypothetical protein
MEYDLFTVVEMSFNDQNLNKWYDWKTVVVQINELLLSLVIRKLVVDGGQLLSFSCNLIDRFEKRTTQNQTWNHQKLTKLDHSK